MTEQRIIREQLDYCLEVLTEHHKREGIRQLFWLRMEELNNAIDKKQYLAKYVKIYQEAENKRYGL